MLCCKELSADQNQHPSISFIILIFLYLLMFVDVWNFDNNNNNKTSALEKWFIYIINKKRVTFLRQATSLLHARQCTSLKCENIDDPSWLSSAYPVRHSYRDLCRGSPCIPKNLRKKNPGGLGVSEVTLGLIFVGYVPIIFSTVTGWGFFEKVLELYLWNRDVVFKAISFV